jgi:hypothetical protein
VVVHPVGGGTGVGFFRVANYTMIASTAIRAAPIATGDAIAEQYILVGKNVN